jgi:hypothetical protein
MDRIENWMNWLADQDWTWWPIESLRPAKIREIDDLRLLTISAVMASLITLLLLIPAWPMRNLVGFKLLMSVLGLAFGSFFFGYKLTFAYCWNRRARRLRATLDASKKPVAPPEMVLRR